MGAKRLVTLKTSLTGYKYNTAIRRAATNVTANIAYASILGGGVKISFLCDQPFHSMNPAGQNSRRNKMQSSKTKIEV